MGIPIDPKLKRVTSGKFHSYLPIWLSWIAGIGLSAIASGVVWNWETTQLREQFPKRANNLTLALQHTIDEYLQVTRAVSAFYDSSEQVTQEEFSRFSQVFFAQNPGILELGWMPYISGENRSIYEEKQQQEIPDFKIRDCDASGQISAAVSRSEYYPTVYLETSGEDRPILGCDRSANTLVRLSLERAKTFGLPTLTQRFVLDNSHGSIFEVYAPIYARTLDGKSRSPEKQVEGFIYVSLNLLESINRAVSSLDLDSIDFYIYDLSFDRLDSSLSKSLDLEQGKILLFYDSEKQEFIRDLKLAPPPITGTINYCAYQQDGTACVRTLNVADREWSVLIVPQKNTLRETSRAIAALTLGLFLTSLFSTYLTGVTQRNLKTEAVNRTLNTELEITRRLHRMFLPKEQDIREIDGLEIAGFMESTDEVGGDYYDVLYHDEGLVIGIGDVTGHGLESSVLTIVVQTAVRTLLANHETDTKKILEALNRVIFGNMQRIDSDKILTLALLEYRDRKLRLSGQHEEAIVIRKAGTVERIDTIDLGFPLGLEEEISQFVDCVSIALNVGDVVILYTDGIPEAENLQGKRYGLDRLCEVARLHVHHSAREIQQVIIADLKQYIGTQKIYDDITLLVLKQL